MIINAKIKKIPLASSEIAALWNTYEYDSMAICMFKHFLTNVDDQKTRKIIKKAKELSESHIEVIQKIYNEENLQLPIAFCKDDVNLKAPRLFTDTLYLYYISTMSSFGIDGYSLFTRYIARSDIRNFFLSCIKESCDLYNIVTELRLEQGTFIRSPRVEVDKRSTFIEDVSFMGNLRGNQRPLIAREVTSIFSGVLFDIIWKDISTGFGQSSESVEVKEFMFKGRDTASSHYKKFSEILVAEHLNTPSHSDSFVTDSIVPVFSNRLMMQHILLLCNFAITVDAFAIASSARADLTLLHTKFAAEIIKYASKGMKIMIANKWMEQPPQVVRHDKL